MLFAQVIVVFTVYALIQAVEQREGDACVVQENGQSGDCIHISKCESVLNAAYAGVLPQLCISKGALSVVCCPRIQSTNATTGSATPIQPTFPNPAATDEGDSCKMKGTETGGECKRFDNCQIAKDAASKGILPQKCNPNKGDDDLICCMIPCLPLPDGIVSQKLTASKAADYCVNLAEKVFPCYEAKFGWTRGDICPLIPSSRRIFHFTPLNTSSEVPHLGKIGTGDRGDVTWHSAATLISDRWVTFSAYYALTKSIKYVGLGGIFQPRYTPDAIYDVVRIVIHPEYNITYSDLYNDIALVQLDREVKFTSRILPACLDTGTLVPNEALFTTGVDNDPHSPAYTKTSLNRLPHAECSGILSHGGRHHPDGLKSNIEMCARPVTTGAGGKCKDIGSGSPLYMDNGPKVACTQLLVGLETWRKKKSCTFIFVRVAGYLPWIERTVWP